MTETKPRRFRLLRWIAALVCVGLVLAAGVAWLNRRALARDALTDWLEARGLASDAEVEALGPTTFVARLSVGDPRHPDFSTERAEVRFRPTLGGVKVVSVTLRKPVLRVSYQKGRLGFGRLDPLVQEILRQPPSETLPKFVVDDGVLVLATDYGPVRLTGDVLFDDNRLKTLSATAGATRLKGPGFDFTARTVGLGVVTMGAGVDLTLSADLPLAMLGENSARESQLSLKARLPYPDLKKARLDGPVTARAQITSQRLARPGQSLDGGVVTADFAGKVVGGQSDLAVLGQMTTALTARSGQSGEAVAKAVQLTAKAPDLSWTRKGGDRASATLDLTGGVETVSAGDLQLSTFTVRGAGPLALSASGASVGLTGSADLRGGWRGGAVPSALDTAQMVAIKRAARGFRVTAPGFTLAYDNGLSVGLTKPAVLIPDRGGAVRLTARAKQPLFGPAGGAFRIQTEGGGLPVVDVDVTRLAFADGVTTASGRLRANVSAGPVESGDIDASGRLLVNSGGVSFVADRCVSLKARQLEFGANDIEAPSARLCATGGPLFTAKGGDWRLAGRLEAATARVPFALAQVDAGTATLTATSRRGRLNVNTRVGSARLRDLSPEARFNPVVLSGDIGFANYLWKANLAARLPGGAAIGHVEVTHDMGLGFGLAVIDTDMLQFASDGLQPLQLSPLASAVGSPVVGSARFQGRFEWARQGASSSGSLTIPGLDFQSAAGAVEGLKGSIVFSSLAPLVAAPGQELEISKVGSVLTFTDLRARFGLADNLLKIAGGEAVVGGGKVRVESLEYPLTPGAPIKGVLIFEGVQLHDLVEASPFGDKVELDAKVSGRMAFETRDGRVRIIGGDLKADQAGRISIDRVALTGVQAEGAVPAVATANDTFTDFAYQAMENLAFDKLDATLASRDDGRLGVLFHIVGRHDPPQKQRIRLSIMDIIQKRFIGRKLPLPSGTGVNLTLDTTLNLDDLLADYAEYRKLHSSAPVQP